jgi:uncharacterized damage-inducible protein DinB
MIRDLAFGDVAHELQQTRRVLERVPMDRHDWQPHAKSFTLGKLAQHVATIPMWGAITLDVAELDLAGFTPPPPVTTSAALLATFDENAAAFQAKLAAAPDDTWMVPWTLRAGDQVFFTLPRLAVMRGTVVNHLVHHRAQLTMYLRALDVPIPGLYGPSADEQ